MKHDIKHVWHCGRRLTDKCLRHRMCKGTDCNNYKARKGSYHSYLRNDPCKGYE